MEPDEIKSLRAELGLTQPEFGARLGVHAMTILKWEKGHSRPVTIHLWRLEDLRDDSDYRFEEPPLPEPMRVPPNAGLKEILRLVGEVGNEC